MAKEIPLTRGLVALVDDEDFEWLSQWKWWVLSDKRGCVYAATGMYRVEQGQQKRFVALMHRVILGLTDPQMIVDHIDGDGLNNRRSNIRTCTRRENAHNRRKDADHSGPYKGVSLRRRSGRWVARIRWNNKELHLGCFATPEEAAHAYDRKALELWGEFAYLNNVEGKIE